MDYIRKSKYNELWFAVILTINPLIKNFISQIRSYFSKQQKEVISNINKGNIRLYSYYNIENSVNKLSTIYTHNINNVVKKSYDRCISETDVKDDFKANSIIEVYKDNYILNIIQKIEDTTVSDITNIYTSCKDKEEFKNKVNEYYNKKCKGYRSVLIAKTEVFRMYNFFYYSYMSLLGYRWKILIAGSMDKKSKVYPLNGKKIFYLDDFVLEDGTRFLYPPAYPNNDSILLHTLY